MVRMKTHVGMVVTKDVSMDSCQNFPYTYGNTRSQEREARVQRLLDT
jgi:hypothetical protein